MAFVKIDKSQRGGYGQGTIEVRMGSHLQSKQGTTRGVYISLSEGAVAKLGWTQHTEDDSPRRVCSVDIQEGVGEDAGFWLMAENEDAGRGYSLGTANEHARAYSVSVASTRLVHYVLNEVPVPTDVVEFTIDEKEKTVLIQCPDWLRYDPTSYKEPEKPVVVEEKKPSPPTKAVDRGVKEVVKQVARDAAKDFPEINRKTRRAAVAAVTRALQ